MTIPIDVEKSFDKIYQQIMMQTPKKLGIERNCLNLLKNGNEGPALKLYLTVKE